MRGCSKGVLLPSWWVVVNYWGAGKDGFVGFVGAFLLIETIAMLLVLRYADALHLRSLSLSLTLPGLLGAILYLLSLTISLEPDLSLLLLISSTALTSIWTGSCHALESTFISEDCKLKSRLKSCQQLDLMRDAGIFSGLILGLLTLYALRDLEGPWKFLGTSGVLLVCSAGSLFVTRVDFQDASIYMKLDLERKLDLTDQVWSMDATAFAELSERDQEHSFLHDTRIEAPRLGGVAITIIVAGGFQVAKTAMWVGVPIMLLKRDCDHEAMTCLESLYLSYVLGTGFGLVVLGVSLRVRDLPVGWDRNLAICTLALSAGVWGCFDHWLDESIFAIVVAMTTLIGVQASTNLYNLVVGPKGTRRYNSLYLISSIFGTLSASAWFLSPISAERSHVFLPIACFSLAAVVLAILLWSESLPHVEYMKKPKYFCMKQLRYPEEVRLEAARRIWAEELKAVIEVKKGGNGEVDYRIKKQSGVWTM